MFCPKCGTENPETGKFCRSCGTDLGNVSVALSGKLPPPAVDRKGRPISWEGAVTTFFMGIAFMTVSIILGVTGMGRGWWFWMLIPAFGMIGSSIAKYIQLKKLEQSRGVGYAAVVDRSMNSAPAQQSLPSSQTDYVSPSAESRFKTGDLVPPSVTDSTTRHLELDSEGQTMTLPKK
jgi:hypothetical protein